MKFLLIFFNLIFLTTQCQTSHCMSCLQESCTMCSAPYKLKNGLCLGQSCASSKCSICDKKNQLCIKCLSFFDLEDGVCKITSFVIVIPIFAFILSLSVCILCICLKKYKKKKLKKTQNQINQKQKIYVLSPGVSDFSNSSKSNIVFKYEKQKNICSICLQAESNLITECGHYFHINCFQNWFKRKKMCPICKKNDLEMLIVIQCSKCKKTCKRYQVDETVFQQIDDDVKKTKSCCSETDLKQNPISVPEGLFEKGQVVLSSSLHLNLNKSI